MAELFLATDSGRQELVVVKRILPYLTHEAEFVRMFLDEARIAAQLHHPNIIQVYELGKLDDSLFISMEYVEGIDVRKVLQQEEAQQGAALPYGPAIYIVSQVCAGLQYAHTATGVDGNLLGVIHRDVSPQNVMVSFDGDVKLVDFGIAKAGSLVERSKPGVIKGKFLYLSPEQLSQERLDHRADLFALGAMMYELTTGKSPFQKSTTEAVIYAIKVEEPMPPQMLRPDYPAELSRIVMKCLVKDRAKRYQSASEIKRDLDSFLKVTRPVEASDLAAYVARLFGTEEDRTLLHVPSPLSGGAQLPLPSGARPAANLPPPPRPTSSSRIPVGRRQTSEHPAHPPRLDEEPRTHQYGGSQDDLLTDERSMTPAPAHGGGADSSEPMTPDKGLARDIATVPPALSMAAIRGRTSPGHPNFEDVTNPLGVAVLESEGLPTASMRVRDEATNPLAPAVSEPEGPSTAPVRVHDEVTSPRAPAVSELEGPSTAPVRVHDEVTSPRAPAASEPKGPPTALVRVRDEVTNPLAPAVPEPESPSTALVRVHEEVTSPRAALVPVRGGPNKSPVREIARDDDQTTAPPLLASRRRSAPPPPAPAPRNPILSGVLAFVVVLLVGLLLIWLVRSGEFSSRLSSLLDGDASQPQGTLEPAPPPPQPIPPPQPEQAPTPSPEPSPQPPPEEKPAPPPPSPPVRVVFKAPRGTVIFYEGKKLSLGSPHLLEPGKFSFQYQCPRKHFLINSSIQVAPPEREPMIVNLACRLRR